MNQAAATQTTAKQAAGAEAAATMAMTEAKPATRQDDELLDGLDRERLEAMRAAGHEIRECYRVLRKVSSNVVAEILKGQGTFYEMKHYPKGDIYDRETHAQYYYHAHRKETGEHGHFHTFLRKKGMPEGMKPAPYDGKAKRPTGEDALTHIVAVSMDKYGGPRELFTTNRWVTGESWYKAEDVIRILDRFVIDHAYPSWPTNRWISAMIVLFRPDIERLLLERDAAIAEWRERHPDRDVLEDKELEIPSIKPIDVDARIRAVEARLG